MDSSDIPRWKRVAQWMRARVGAFFSFAALCTGIFLFGKLLHSHYPIQRWLFLRYAGYWFATLSVAFGSYGLGHVILTRLRVRMALYEHALVSLALGIFGFELLMFGLGLARGFNLVSFVALPVLLCGAVAWPMYKHAKHVSRVITRARRRSPPLGIRSFALAFGLIGLGMVYFYVMTPNNIQFDARWKHLALAEQFVAQHGVRPAVEGWVFTARPHFTSFLYTWAFLFPGRLFDKMEIAAHIEFFLFAVTAVVGIPAIVRKLVPKADPRWIWAARFVFPGVMLYDSSVSGGADHVGAFFCAAIAVCLFRALRELDLRYSALVGIFLAAAAVTKETVAIMLVPMPAMLITGRALGMAYRTARKQVPDHLRKRWILAPLLAGACALLFSAPLWGANLAFYGDPFYPLLNTKLHPHPFTDQAAYRLKYGYLDGMMWAPSRDWAGLKRTFTALFDFSFIPNDWGKFHRNVPVFGSLFTLLLPCVLVLGKQKRLWVLLAWTHFSIFTWYSVHHQDRYLQALLPLMAACTAAIALLVWRKFGTFVRIALASVFALQIVWGGDVYFIPAHVHAKVPAKEVIDLLGAGFERKYDDRFSIQGSWQQIGEATPKGSRILLHLFGDYHAHLGTNRETVLDAYLWQFGIEYGAAGTPEGVRKMLREKGVTHVFAAPDKRSDATNSIAADILFWEFSTRNLIGRRQISNGMFGAVPDKPLTANWSDLVAVLSCSKKAPPKGLFHVTDLRPLPYGPDAHKFGKPVRSANTNEEAMALVQYAQSVVLEKGCFASERSSTIIGAFDLIVERRESKTFHALEIFSRKNGRTATPLTP